jgi:uncharacterized protein YdaU (DUF1376 family)
MAAHAQVKAQRDPTFWMKVYPGDYLRDTTGFAAVEHGAYWLLILHYWISGAIPDHNDKLRRIMCLDSGQDDIITSVMERFERTRPLMDAAWFKANKTRAQLMEASRKGVEAREAKRQPSGQPTPAHAPAPASDKKEQERKNSTIDASIDGVGFRAASNLHDFGTARSQAIRKRALDLMDDPKAGALVFKVQKILAEEDLLAMIQEAEEDPEHDPGMFRQEFGKIAEGM